MPSSSNPPGPLSNRSLDDANADPRYYPPYLVSLQTQPSAAPHFVPDRTNPIVAATVLAAHNRVGDAFLVLENLLTQKPDTDPELVKAALDLAHKAFVSFSSRPPYTAVYLIAFFF